MLKPVTDLSIGLETTGADAAEFLVQTLNAFGAGSEEAQLACGDIQQGREVSGGCDGDCRLRQGGCRKERFHGSVCARVL